MEPSTKIIIGVVVVVVFAVLAWWAYLFVKDYGKKHRLWETAAADDDATWLEQVVQGGDPFSGTFYMVATGVPKNCDPKNWENCVNPADVEYVTNNSNLDVTYWDGSKLIPGLTNNDIPTYVAKLKGDKVRLSCNPSKGCSKV